MLDNQCGLPIPVCLLAGAAAAVVGGVLLAVPALRLRGPYFGLVTLVAVLLLQNVIVLFAGITGGEIGLTCPTCCRSMPHQLLVRARLHGVSGAILFRPVALGRRPDPAGERPGCDRGAALGFNVAKHKLAAFCVSALFSGLAGAMLIFYMGTASVGTVVDIGDRRADHHRRRAGRPAHHPGRGDRLDLPDRRRANCCARSASSPPSSFRRRAGGHPVLPRRLPGLSRCAAGERE